MKRNQYAMILGVTLLFAYQNCQKPPHQDEMIQSANTTNETIHKQVPLVEENVQGITFSSTEKTTVQKNSKTFTLLANVIYSVHLPTGEINSLNEATEEAQKYCLDSQLKSELQDLLNVSKVCEYQLPEDPNRTCDMSLRPPYAELATNREVFRLGSASDGCGSNKVDLCDNSGVLLRTWFKSVQDKLTTLSCQK